MTPKEKAIELVNKFNPISNWWIDSDTKCKIQQGKECALIAADECLHTCECLNTCVESMVYYWQEVKQEIEKL